MNKSIKILNLYACLGGNRYKWDEVADIDVTAVEHDPELVKLYKERFPNDKVVQADAHEYLLKNFKDYDFIWSSPPCPTHGRSRFWKSKGGVYDPVYPDMKLYQEIILLDTFYEGKYVVENVIPYYTPLIAAQKHGRHLYWANFQLPQQLNERKDSPMGKNNEVRRWCKFHDFDFYQYKGKQRKDKIARNLVDYQAGKSILQAALKVEPQSNQGELF